MQSLERVESNVLPLKKSDRRIEKRRTVAVPLSQADKERMVIKKVEVLDRRYHHRMGRSVDLMMLYNSLCRYISYEDLHLLLISMAKEGKLKVQEVRIYPWRYVMELRARKYDGRREQKSENVPFLQRFFYSLP
jgi:hypothetical protein